MEQVISVKPEELSCLVGNLFAELKASVRYTPCGGPNSMRLHSGGPGSGTCGHPGLLYFPRRPGGFGGRPQALPG